jgi:hypothetical protein
LHNTEYRSHTKKNIDYTNGHGTVWQLVYINCFYFFLKTEVLALGGGTQK